MPPPVGVHILSHHLWPTWPFPVGTRSHLENIFTSSKYMGMWKEGQGNSIESFLHTFIRLLRQVKHPVFVRRLISYK